MERYKIIKVVGEGNFGCAFLCRDTTTNMNVIVKEIAIEKQPPDIRKASLNEAKILSKIKHPSIVGFIDSFIENKKLYIVMEYAEGGDLSTFIKSRNGKHFPEKQIISWMHELCLALNHVHSMRILHRDIKSQNIFLDSMKHAKLGDFGIAKVLENSMDFAKTMVGSPFYLSPEICNGEAYNSKTDVWSLGCVFYEMCTLKPAFGANNMGNVIVKIMMQHQDPIPKMYSKELGDLIDAMLQKNPVDRPTMAEILDANLFRSKTPEVPRPTISSDANIMNLNFAKPARVKSVKSDESMKNLNQKGNNGKNKKNNFSKSGEPNKQNSVSKNSATKKTPNFSKSGEPNKSKSDKPQQKDHQTNLPVKNMDKNNSSKPKQSNIPERSKDNASNRNNPLRKSTDPTLYSKSKPNTPPGKPNEIANNSKAKQASTPIKSIDNKPNNIKQTESNINSKPKQNDIDRKSFEGNNLQNYKQKNVKSNLIEPSNSPPRTNSSKSNDANASSIINDKPKPNSNNGVVRFNDNVVNFNNGEVQHKRTVFSARANYERKLTPINNDDFARNPAGVNGLVVSNRQNPSVGISASGKKGNLIMHYPRRSSPSMKDISKRYNEAKISNCMLIQPLNQIRKPSTGNPRFKTAPIEKELMKVQYKKISNVRSSGNIKPTAEFYQHKEEANARKKQNAKELREYLEKTIGKGKMIKAYNDLKEEIIDENEILDFIGGKGNEYLIVMLRKLMVCEDESEFICAKIF